MSAPAQELLAEGHAALQAGDAAAARRAFQRAGSETGDALEGLARAAYLELDFQGAIALWERAYAAHRATGDHVGSVRVARTLSYMYGMIVGDGAVMRGWLARSQTLLGARRESREGGWVALQLGIFDGDPVRKEQRLREALQLARRFGDTELELASLAYYGSALVHADRTEEGMVLLDEALAGVAGGEVDDFVVLQDVFCQLFAACEHANDVTRAEQWIRVGETVAARRKLPTVAAWCHTHYGAVLTAAGRWPEAEAALTEAVRLWTLGRAAARGGALIRLADLRVRQGRFEEAEELLRGLETFWEAARPLAAIHLARGDIELAADILERALDQLDPMSTAAAPLLALQVDVHLAAGRTEEAAAAAQRLSACAQRHASPYLSACAALAQGQVFLATGSGDAQACLREALAGFARAQTPMEVALSRLELAHALLEQRPEVALAEARAALEAFDRLRAARHVDAAAAVLRALGVRAATARKSAGLLTKREDEILELLGHGLSNPEISQRLYISRKTVEHHVANILAKLGLRSRAEAAAYAARTKSGVK